MDSLVFCPLPFAPQFCWLGSPPFTRSPPPYVYREVLTAGSPQVLFRDTLTHMEILLLDRWLLLTWFSLFSPFV